MTKKLLCLMVVLVLSVTALASCNFGNLFDKPNTDDPDGNGGQGGGQTIENMIYNSDSELQIVIGEGATAEEAIALSDAIVALRGTAVPVVNASSEESEHEIIIGGSDRDVTSAALMRLNREIEDYTNDYSATYVIYSDGSSIAIVFSEDYEGVSKKLALDYVKEELLSETLTAASGIVELNNFNIVDDYYTPLDTAHKNEILARVEEQLGKETTAALVSMTGLYDFGLIEWIAGLYDPCICVCKGMGEEVCQNTKYCEAEGGGFYFSNSARDTVGFLPDLESTRQALDMISMSGMCWMYGNSYKTGALPAEMLEAIGRYTQVLQSPDGYFRHPQWSGVEDKDMRLNRDLNWAITLLGAAKMSPYYTTPTGVPGIGAPKASSGSLTTNVGNSKASAVSKVISVAAAYPAVLKDEASWGAFLEELGQDFRKSSYGNGSRLGTYSAQVLARDKEIGTPDDPTPLMDLTIEFLNKHMNPERGTWVWDEANGGNSKQMGAYAETNGVMKIYGYYSRANQTYPHAIECMRICAEVLVTDEVPTGTVDVYNAWIALRGVYDTVMQYGTSDEKAEVDAFMQNFRKNAKDAVIASRDKFAAFRIDDGSYSYWPDYNHGYSTGMYVGVSGTKEGDVNGALIASADSWGFVCSGLGIEKIPLFGAAELHKFRDIIANTNPVIKQGSNMNYTVLDFEDDEVGDAPTGPLNLGLRSPGSSADVVYDDATDNNYVKFVTNTSVGDSFYVTCESRSNVANSYVFEGDLCVEELNTTFGFQVMMGSCHILLIKLVNGEIRLVEASSDSTGHSLDRDLGVSLPLGTWFRLKIEYYLGDHDSVRIKIYFDDLSDGADELQLLAVTDNYFSKYGEKFESGGSTPSTKFEQTHIYSYSTAAGILLLDNLASYRTKDVYKPETDPNKQPLVYNIDPPNSPEKVYDFSSATLPEELKTSGAATVKNGELAITGSSDITLPINVRTAGSKCATTVFDLTCAKADAGTEILTVTLLESIDKMISLIFKVEEDADGKYITCYEKNEALGSVIPGVHIQLGKKSTVKIDFHHNEDVALIYVDGNFVGASGAIYTKAERRTASTLSISTAEAAGYELSLDNLIFEKNKNDYIEATEPNKNSVYYDFESANADVDLSGAASLGAMNIGGASKNVAKLPSGSGEAAISIPINNRANLYSVTVIDMDLYFQSANQNGETHLFTLKDQLGKAIYSLAIKINGDLVEFYEVGKGGIAAARVAKANKADLIDLTVEIYPINKIIYIMVGGACMAKSSIFADPDNIEATPGSFEIKALTAKSVLGVDNLKAETLYELYEEREARAENNTDTSNPLTFDKSNTGSIPSDMKANAANIRIENVYNDVKNEYSNAAVLDTIRGKNETIGVRLDKINNQSCVTFEVDFMIKNAEYDHITQLFLTNSKEEASKAAYGMIFSKAGTGYRIATYAGGATKETLVSGLEFGTWYNLKIEYFVLESGEARIKVYFNGILKYVSDNYYNIGNGDAQKDIKAAYFYTFLDSKASIYVDNMSIISSDATCNDTVGAK